MPLTPTYLPMSKMFKFENACSETPVSMSGGGGKMPYHKNVSVNEPLMSHLQPNSVQVVTALAKRQKR